MADRLTGGQLEASLSRYRAARTPWKVIARLLQAEFGVEASPETLAAWSEQLGIGEPEPVK